MVAPPRFVAGDELLHRATGLGLVNKTGRSSVLFGVTSPRIAEPRIHADSAVDGAKAEGEAFADFYRQHYRSVLGIVLTLSGSATAAEELTQDAFVKAHRRWDELLDHDNPEAWVKRVAINLARSWGRRRVAEVKAIARLRRQRPTVESLPESAEQIWAAVRQLPGNQAASIALRYHDDKSIDEIAAVLGCSAATVRVHLHRGRRTLASRLQLDLEEETDEA